MASISFAFSVHHFVSSVGADAGAASPVAARTASGDLNRASAPVPAGVPVAPAGVGAPALSSATRLIPISETDPISAHSNGGGAVASLPGPAPATAAGGAN